MLSCVPHVFSLQARLYSLQADPATYCNEPDGESVAQQEVLHPVAENETLEILRICILVNTECSFF